MKQVFLLLLLIAIPMQLFAQQPEWKVLLNSDQPLCIAQNGDQLWLGTYGGGVVRYEKKTGAQTYFNRINSSLRDLNIASVAFDNSNVTWVSSQDGLASYDGANWKTFTTANSSLPSNVINSIIFDHKRNKLLIGTGGGLVFFDPASHNCQTFTISNSGLKNNNILRLALDSIGTIWIITSNEGYKTIGALSSFDGTTWTNFLGNNADSTQLRDDDLKNVAVDIKGNIWVTGYSSFVFRSNGLKWLRMQVPNSNDGVHGLATSADGTIWLGSYHGMMQVDDTGTVLQYFSYSTKDSTSFPNGGAYAISIDNDGSVWSGSYGGLTHLIGKKSTTVSTSNSGLLGNMISALTVTPSGDIMISSGSNISSQLQYVHGSTWSKLKAPVNGNSSNFAVGIDGTAWASLGSGIGILEADSIRPVPATIAGDDDGNSIWAFAVRNKNEIWEARQFTLAHFDGTDWKRIDYTVTGFGLFNGQDMKIDRNGTLWYGMTYNGLLSFDGTTWKKYAASSSGFTGETVNAIEFDSSGITWVASDKGLFSFDGNSWKVLTPTNSSMPFLNIGALVVENLTSIWISSGDFGVSKIAHYDGSKWESFDNTNSPLGQNTISSLSIDALGNLWIGTKGDGIALYKKGGVVLDVKQKEYTITSSIKIFPNPATEIVTLDIPPTDRTSIVIYNELGSIATKIDSHSDSNLQLNVKNYPAGMYHVRCGNSTASFIKN